MKVSIITVCFNSAKTIKHTIQSVIDQNCSNIEYIIIDGASTDNTLSIIERYKDNIDLIISEKDNGIYDALNKGIEKCSGDIIGFLHADDFFKNNNVIQNILDSFINNNIDMLYGNIQYVDQSKSEKVIRYWRAGKFFKGIFKWGWMPPHTSFFLLKSCYQKYGNYLLNLGTSADYELMLRMFELNQLKSHYLDEVLTCMRIGGASNITLKNRWLANRYDKKSWQINQLKPFWFTFILKPLRKVPQFLKLRSNVP